MFSRLYYLYKHNYDYSGSIDWLRQVKQYQKKYKNIMLIRCGKKKLVEYFKITDCFLTDTSGLGFEFVLATAKSILFLGNKLKIPLPDLRSDNIGK